MGFFGNTAYYLTDAFKKIVFKNKNIPQNSSPAPVETFAEDNVNNLTTDPIIFFPNSANENLLVNSGNKWLIFQRDTTSNNNINVYHKKADGLNISSAQNDALLQILAVPGANDQVTNTTAANAKQLQQGAIITGVDFKYDKAGHINALVPKYYKLPITSSEQDYQNLVQDMENIKTLNNDLDGENEPRDVIEVIQGLRENMSDLQENVEDLNNLLISIPSSRDIPDPDPGSLLYQFRTLQATVNIIMQAIGLTPEDT